MNEYTIILGAAMTAFIFINFFTKSWFIGFAAILLGIGCVVSMPSPINPFLFAAVAVVAVGQMVALIIAKHNETT